MENLKKLIEEFQNDDGLMIIDRDGIQCYFDFNSISNKPYFSNGEHFQTEIIKCELYKNNDGTFSAFGIELENKEYIDCFMYKQHEMKL